MAIYRGRLAPSPTGRLHRGHLETFSVARDRARAAGGELLLRIEDLDRARCKPEFVEAILKELSGWDLLWHGKPLYQSQRDYMPAWRELRENGWIYPCNCSRKDVVSAIGAPQEGDEDLIYPGTCRVKNFDLRIPTGWNWRFRVPVGEKVEFLDLRLGLQKAVSGVDFGDFLVWRKDGIPAYELAVVVDDVAMEITEVVRGEDLVKSTFRQMLIYRALGFSAPQFYHCPLIRDHAGLKLSK